MSQMMEDTLRYDITKYRERIAGLEAELKWLQNQHVRVCSSESRLRDACKAFTGSLWPQNETTEALAKLLEKA